MDSPPRPTGAKSVAFPGHPHRVLQSRNHGEMALAVRLFCLLWVMAAMPSCRAAPSRAEGVGGRRPITTADQNVANPRHSPPIAWILPDNAVYFAPEDLDTLKGGASRGETARALDTINADEGSRNTPPSPTAESPKADSTQTGDSTAESAVTPSAQPLQTTSSTTTESAIQERSPPQTENSVQQRTQPSGKVPQEAQAPSGAVSNAQSAKDQPHSRRRRFILSLLGYLLDSAQRHDEPWDEFNRPLSQYHKRGNRRRPYIYPTRWIPSNPFGGLTQVPSVPLVPKPTPKATPAAIIKPFPSLGPTFPVIGVQSDTWIWPKGDITGSLPNSPGVITNLLG